jgi:hypothetical protein
MKHVQPVAEHVVWDWSPPTIGHFANGLLLAPLDFCFEQFEPLPQAEVFFFEKFDSPFALSFIRLCPPEGCLARLQFCFSC